MKDFVGNVPLSLQISVALSFTSNSMALALEVKTLLINK